MRKLLMECVGAMFLVMAVGFSGNPIAVGLTLAVMVYAGGHVSGAHYNPAVSVAVWLRGKLETRDLLPYVAAQLVGAALGWTIHFLVVGEGFAPAPGADVLIWQAVLVEALFAFALATVVLNVATSSKLEGNSIYGFAIGGTVAAGAFAVGGISGGAFNPAVGLGPQLMKWATGEGFAASSLALYALGPVTGAALAALVFRYLQPDED